MNLITILGFLTSCGYLYPSPNAAQAEQGYILSQSMDKVFPQEGSLQEYDEVIVVKFSDKNIVNIIKLIINEEYISKLRP